MSIDQNKPKSRPTLRDILAAEEAARTSSSLQSINHPSKIAAAPLINTPEYSATDYTAG